MCAIFNVDKFFVSYKICFFKEINILIIVSVLLGVVPSQKVATSRGENLSIQISTVILFHSSSIYI